MSINRWPNKREFHTPNSFKTSENPLSTKMASYGLSHVIVGAFFLFLVIQPITAQGNFMVSTKKSNFLSSLYKLEGVQKDQTKEGLIKQLKTYLKALGYSSTSDELPNMVVMDDVFDDGLESAIKLYQEYNHLKVTGKLDSDTIRAMSIPLYDEPNNINRTVTRPRKKNGHRPNHYFHEVSHYAFFGTKWSKSQLSYAIDLSNSPISGQDMSAICSRSFGRWADVSSLSFREASQGEQHDIQIGFRSVDGTYGVLARGYQPQIGLLYFDSAEYWSTSTPTQAQVDLESVAIHEIGHVLGLQHSQYRSAVMYESIGPGEVKRDLQQDDINGIQLLYPQ